MQLDFYAVKKDDAGRLAPDLERELVRADAVARAKCGDAIVLKLWLRTDGPADLERLEATIAAAVQPLGLK